VRIGLFTTLFPSKEPFEFENSYQWGGVAEVVYELSLQLNKRGHDVFVFSASNGSETAQSYGDITVYRYEKTASLHTSYLSLDLLRKPASVDLDIVHIHRGLPSAALSGTISSILNRTPTVFTVHGNMDPGPLRSKKGILLRGFNAISPWLLSRADAVTTVTSRFRDSSKYLSRYDGNVTVIPNGVSTDSGLIEAHDDERTIDSKSDETHILFVGNLIERKQPDLLLPVAETLRKENPDLRVVIIGDGPMKSSLEREVRERNLSDIVQVLGFVDETTKQQWYHKADILCLPSMDESFGLTPLEAAARRTVPVVSDIPCFQEYITDKENGLIVRPTESGLHKALKQLLANPEKRRQMAERAQSDAAKYNWREISDQYIEIYRSVL
jgi:glycosyltransferase involved in cell wall biosynthesis